MKNKLIVIMVILAAGGAGFYFWKSAAKEKNGSRSVVREIKPVYGNIQSVISATGTVQPQNRLEVKPAINGRIDEILVKEGERVKKGQNLAFMSSMDRAALLDAAAAQGNKTLEYWSEVYKQVPLTAPIDAEVIVRAVEPGQTVTTSSAVLVLSDRLIVSAQLDETDIGKIRIGQRVTITLDAYPNEGINGIVDHIAYESRLVNNVTIYDVDVLPEKVPEFFRSGMSANVDIVQDSKENVLLIPNEALIKEKEGTYVKISNLAGGQIELKKVELGMSDDIHSEVISGLSPSDSVVIENKEFSVPKNNGGTNPFMPSRRAH